MTWHVVADFLSSERDVWLDDFIDDPRLDFRKIPRTPLKTDWHRQAGMKTGVRRWLEHLAQARRALRGSPEGVITCYPPLAMCAGLLAALRRRPPRIVAYHFNIGELRSGVFRKLARLASKRIDCFVVHSPTEIPPYAAYLGVPEDRLVFIPVQRGDFKVRREEDMAEPYVLAMGSAHRDYETLIRALEDLKPRTIIVTRKDIIDTLPERPWIDYRHGLSADDCRDLLARARLSVTPVANTTTASGQITFVSAMRLGVPVIATRCPGTAGYIDHDRTGLLVDPFDAPALQAAVEQLWSDPERRRSLSAEARAEAEARFSDPAVAARLRDILLDMAEAG